MKLTTRVARLAQRLWDGSNVPTDNDLTPTDLVVIRFVIVLDSLEAKLRRRGF